jgi:hypothetical protein
LFAHPREICPNVFQNEGRSSISIHLAAFGRDCSKESPFFVLVL